MKKLRRLPHSFIMRFIAWYIAEKCGCASHVYEYGPNGRYVVIMSEEQYHNFRKKCI